MGAIYNLKLFLFFRKIPSFPDTIRRKWPAKKQVSLFLATYYKIYL